MGDLTSHSLFLGAVKGFDSMYTFDNDCNLVTQSSLCGTDGNTKHRPNSLWHSGNTLTILADNISGIQTWFDIDSTGNKDIFWRPYVYNKNTDWHQISIIT